MSEVITVEMHTALNALRRLPPRARLRVIALALPEVAQDLDTAKPPPQDQWDAEAQAAETEFKQELVEMGLLTEVKDPTMYPTQDDRTPPVTVDGTPLSEMIIAERR